MLNWLTQSYWRDEAFSILLARRSFVDIVKLSAGDFTPPLYHLILKVWIWVFGPTEAATRLLSTLCFVLTLAVLILFARKILHLSWRYSILSIFIIGLSSPVLVYYAFEARAYALLAFLATASWYTFLQKKWKWYLCFAITGLYTHYFMLFVVGLQLIYSLLLRSPQANRKTTGVIFSPFAIRHFRPRWISLWLTLLAFVPWLAYTALIHHGSMSQAFWIPKPFIYDLLVLPALIATGHERGLPYAYNLYPITLVLLGIVGLSMVGASRRHLRNILPLLSWALIPGVLVWIASQFTTPLFLPRYLMVSAPALILILAVSLYRFKRHFQILGLILIVAMLWHYQNLQLTLRTKHNLRSKIARARAQSDPADYLLVASELDFHVAQIYWGDPDKVKIVGKTYEEIPGYVGKVLIPQSAMATPEILSHPNSFLLTNGHISRQ